MQPGNDYEITSPRTLLTRNSHAEARERLYSHAPNMYGTRDGQTHHQG